MANFITYQQIGIGDGIKKSFSFTIDSLKYVNQSFFLISNGTTSANLSASNATTELITDDGGLLDVTTPINCSYVRSTGVLSLFFNNAPLEGKIVYVKYIATNLQLITAESLHSFNYDYQLNPGSGYREIDDGYSIYMQGSSATFAISVLSSTFFDDRCNVACYKSNASNQWVLLGKTGLDRGQNYGFAFNCIQNAVVFPEEAIFSWVEGEEYKDTSHSAGEIILTLRDQTFTIPVTANQSIMTKIMATVNVLNNSSQWYAQQIGNTVLFSKRTATFVAASGFSLDLSPVNITSGFSIGSNGTNVGTGVTNYEDFDCARWKVVIEIPYGDKRNWCTYKINAYNTPTIQNGQEYIDNNFKDYLIYQWSLSKGSSIKKGVTYNTPDDFCVKTPNSTSSQINSNNYNTFCLRGRY